MYETVYVYHRVCISPCMYITRVCISPVYVYHRIHVWYCINNINQKMYTCIANEQRPVAKSPAHSLLHHTTQQHNTQGCTLVLRWEAAEEESGSVFVVHSLPS
jgi:hypothetical protein